MFLYRSVTGSLDHPTARYFGQKCCASFSATPSISGTLPNVGPAAMRKHEQLWMWAASRLSLKSVNVFMVSLCHGIFTKSLTIRNDKCMYPSWSFHHDLGCRFHYKVQLQRFAEPEGPVVNGSNSACSACGDSNSTNHGEVNQPKPKLACRRSPDKLPSKMSRTSVFFTAFVWGESKKSHISIVYTTWYMPISAKHEGIQRSINFCQGSRLSVKAGTSSHQASGRKLQQPLLALLSKRPASKKDQKADMNEIVGSFWHQETRENPESLDYCHGGPCFL